MSKHIPDGDRPAGWEGEARMFWDMSYAHAPKDDTAAWELIRASAIEAPASLSTLAGQRRTQALALWCHCGFPEVQLHGHKYAAALACTSFPVESDVRRPWPSFVIKLPTATFAVPGQEQVFFHSAVFATWPMNIAEGTSKEISVLFVRGGDGSHGNCFEMFRQGALSSFASRGPLGPLIEPESHQRVLGERSENERVLAAVSRLVIGVCMAMTDRAMVKAIGKPSRQGPRRVYIDGKISTHRAFRIGRPINVDCREPLAQWLSGERRSGAPSVRWLAKGHWRNQACGPQLLERRMQWIEPYWNNRKADTIARRPHVLGKLPKGDEPS